MKPIIYLLVKTFENADYAESFLDGSLYMNTLEYFLRIEDSIKAGRGDSNEGVIAWFQPDQIQLQINDILINSYDLVGPVSAKYNHHLNTNIFCMHASYIGGSGPYEFSSASAFENHLKIPEENIELGQHSILITNVKALLDRIKNVVNINNFKMQARLMEYYDPTVFHGVFKEEEAVFKKHLRFSHQREYRIAIDTGINIGSHIVLEISSIRDIAIKLPIDSLNKAIKIVKRRT